MRSTSRPRTPTIRPSATAMSSAQPFEQRTHADCTQRSTSSSEMPSASIVSTREGQSSPRPKGVLVPQISAIRCGVMPSVTDARYPVSDSRKQCLIRSFQRHLRKHPDDLRTALSPGAVSGRPHRNCFLGLGFGAPVSPHAHEPPEHVCPLMTPPKLAWRDMYPPRTALNTAASVLTTVSRCSRN